MKKVVYEQSVTKDVDRLPAVIRVRVLGIIGRLRNWPAVSGVKPLRERLAGKYRIRTGDYRVQFRVESDRIVIERVGHRDGFYDE